MGKVDKSQANKVFIEKFDGSKDADAKEPCQITVDDVKTGVFVGNCKGPFVVQLKGKCKNITISNCVDIAVVFDTCVTTVEIIGSQKCQVQAQVAAGSYIVDKCDRTTLYLAEASLADKVVLFSCQSTATTVHQPKGDDMVEHGIPNQILSTFKKDTAPTHAVVLPDGQ